MKLALPAILLAALLVALSSFDAGGPEPDLTVVQSNDGFTLDPQRMTWQHDIRTGRAIHEMLVTVDPEPGTVRPGVAERWEVAGDGRTWTFRLRADARWSNGDPVTAADFVAGWRRAMVPDTAADYAGFLEEVEGARELSAFRQAQLKAFAALPEGERSEERARALWDESMAFADRTVGAQAMDERTLRVTLRAPLPYWLSIAAFPVTAPVHRATIARFTSFDAASGRRVEDPAWARPEHLVCNGRYTVTDWRFGRRMRLERNPMHWDRSEGPPACIDLVPIEDANTAVLAFESGAAGWLPDVRADYKADLVAESARWLERNRALYDELRAKGADPDAALAELPAPGRGERRDVHVVPNFGTDFFSYNCRPTLAGGAPNPFADAAVRRAFTLAVDRQAIADRIVRIGEPAAATLVPPGTVPGYRSPAGLPFDAERARREMAAAGWGRRGADGVPVRDDGTRFPTVDLLYSTGNPRFRDVSLALAAMWRRELGVDTQLRAMESKQMKPKLREGDFMVARGSWYGDYDDPCTFLDLCRTGDGNNDRGYSCAEFDALLARAAAERDPAARLAVLSDAERMVTERDAAVLPVTHYATVMMYDPARLRGVTRDPSFDQLLSDLRVLPRR